MADKKKVLPWAGESLHFIIYLVNPRKYSNDSSIGWDKALHCIKYKLTIGWDTAYISLCFGIIIII